MRKGMTIGAVLVAAGIALVAGLVLGLAEDEKSYSSVQSTAAESLLLPGQSCCTAPALSAVQASTLWNENKMETVYVVLEGYVMVIEFVSVLVAPAGLQRAWLYTEVDGKLEAHSLHITPKSWEGGAFIVSQSLRLYASPGTHVQFKAWTLPDEYIGEVTISGYLVATD